MRIATFLFVALTACAQFPALEGTISDAARDAPYPALSSLPPVASQDVAVADDALAARIAALQARAARLRRINIAALQ